MQRLVQTLRRKPKNRVKRCKNFFGRSNNKTENQLLFEAQNAIQVCIGWKIAGNVSYLGSGSYGAVFGAIFLRSRKFKKNERIYVAFKIQTLKDKCDAFRREIRYGIRLGELQLGPKIYRSFIYRLKNKYKEPTNKYRGIVMMEGFRYSGEKMFDLQIVNAVQSMSAFQQMLTLIDQVSAAGIFCRDIKPNNFVANIGADNTINVRMIDFGINACEDNAPFYIEHIQEVAGEEIRATQQPQLRRILGETQRKGEEYSVHLFTNTIKASLILQVFKLLKKKRKNRYITETQFRTIMIVTVPFLEKICYNETELRNVTEAIIHSKRLYEIFMWYLDKQKLFSKGQFNPVVIKSPGGQQYRRSAQSVFKSKKREFVLEKFQTLCRIDAWLKDIPRKKKGWLATLKRRFRPRGGYRTRRKRHRRRKRPTRRKRRTRK